MNAININNVNFHYQDTEIFSDFSLSIREGEYVAIVGANGSGKTTLLNLLSGALQPETGNIQIDGIDLNESLEKRLLVSRNYLSTVLQNPEDQFVGSTVRDDIAFGLENKSISAVEMDVIIAEVADQMGLTTLLDKAPNQLSGGQKQRVAIASSLAMKTKYLLLDEATSQLDPISKIEVMLAIQTLATTYHKTVVMVTHDVTEILQAKRVIVLDQGQIVADMSPQKLFMSDLDLAKYHLQAPPILTYSQELQNAGVINEICFSVDELVEEICK